MKKLLALLVFTFIMTTMAAPCLADQWYTVVMKCSAKPGLTYTEHTQAKDEKEAAEKGMEMLKQRSIYPGGCQVVEVKPE